MAATEQDAATNAPQLWLAGAAPDTGNLGVTALGHSVLHGLATRLPGVRFSWLDHGRGARPETVTVGALEIPVVRRGFVNSRRLHRAESLTTMRVDAALGLGLTPNVRSLKRADAVLDISGGDSFADLYGPARFATVCGPKRLALSLRRRLILLPQTYGPFEGEKTRREAIRLVRGAASAWARDAQSFALLREMLGDTFDPARHGETVDVAFLLPRKPNSTDLPEHARAWFEAPAGSRQRPVVGLNVSGLIFNDPEAARSRFGLRADYRELVIELTRRLVVDDGANVLLVPHVVPPRGHPESDPDACEAVVEAVRSRAPDAAAHLCVAPTVLDPGVAKDRIADCDWFCGTRMHATIGGLSTGVPTAALAYSLKTTPVFATCGVADQVVDPRSLDTAAALESLRSCYAHRDDVRDRLARALPTVRERASATMDRIASSVLPTPALR